MISNNWVGWLVGGRWRVVGGWWWVVDVGCWIVICGWWGVGVVVSGWERHTNFCGNFFLMKKKKIMSKVFWLEQLDTLTMDELYFGQPFAILQCFQRELWISMAWTVLGEFCSKSDILEILKLRMMMIPRSEILGWLPLHCLLALG